MNDNTEITIHSQDEGENIDYFLSGPFLKKELLGDKKAYSEAIKKRALPITVLSSTAAAAAAGSLPFLGLAAYSDSIGSVKELFNVITLLPRAILDNQALQLISGVVALPVGAVTAFFTYEAQEKAAHNKAGLGYIGINMLIASDKEIQDFIGNNDPEITEQVKEFSRNYHKTLSGSMLYDQTQRPETGFGERFTYNGSP